MSFVRTHRTWLFGLLALFCVAAVVGGMAVRDSAVADQAQADLRPVGHGKDLATAFREITRQALPGIVSIETRGKPIQLTSGVQDPFGEDSPFRRFFGDDPQLREFFERLPEQRDMPRSRNMGSGFVIDSAGVILTNSHVVRNADEVKVTLHDGREFVATDIRHDPISDVAIVRIDAPRDLHALPLGDSGRMEIGDWVLAVGSPFGLRGTVTAGIISGKGRGPGIAQREDFLQTDAAINPGNSGGPLLNLDGEVIGINTAISSRNGGNQGVGFAIPINMAKWVSQQLEETGQVRRAFLGVTIQPVDSRLAEQFGVNVGQGAIVTRVMSDSPAEKAELRTGDVILTLDGRDVSGPRELQGIVERLDVGKTYSLVILRDGGRKTLSVTLARMPEQVARAGIEKSPEAEEDAAPSAFAEIGIDVQDMTPSVARQLGFDENTRGVLVTDVTVDGPAYEAGTRTGQIIERVGSKEIGSTEELRAAIDGLSVEEGIVMLVRSREGSRFVVVQSR